MPLSEKQHIYKLDWKLPWRFMISTSSIRHLILRKVFKERLKCYLLSRKHAKKNKLKKLMRDLQLGQGIIQNVQTYLLGHIMRESWNYMMPLINRDKFVWFLKIAKVKNSVQFWKIIHKSQVMLDIGAYLKMFVPKSFSKS